MTSQVNSTKHLEQSYTYPSQTLPKYSRGRNTPKLILQGHHHQYQNQTKMYRKRKLLANITDEHRCKNPQQNTSKQNPTAN